MGTPIDRFPEKCRFKLQFFLVMAHKVLLCKE